MGPISAVGSISDKTSINISYMTYNKQLSILSSMALAFLLDLDLSQSLSRQRVFRDRINPIDVYNDIEFIARYRVTKYMFVQLQEKVVTFLHRSTIRSHSIPAPTQQFLATGSFQTVVATSHGISQPSVTDALCFFARHYIVFPNQIEQLRIQQKFFDINGFPLVLG